MHLLCKMLRVLVLGGVMILGCSRLCLKAHGAHTNFNSQKNVDRKLIVKSRVETYNKHRYLLSSGLEQEWKLCTYRATSATKIIMTVSQEW